MDTKTLNIAFYCFTPIVDPVEVKMSLKKLCEKLGLKGTILVSSEGLNSTLSGAVPAIRLFQEEIKKLSYGKDIEFKESYSDFVPFQKLFVKLKKEIIPIGDLSIRPEITKPPRITAQELKQWLDEDRDFQLLDTRNDYEVKYGTFRKATHFELNHFRNFPKKMAELPEDSKKKPLVMFCTGGIRCEKAAIVAQNMGFNEVYQLDGGILKYFEECGDSHYDGACFVFDERVAVTSHLEPIVQPKE